MEFGVAFGWRVEALAEDEPPTNPNIHPRHPFLREEHPPHLRHPCLRQLFRQTVTQRNQTLQVEHLSPRLSFIACNNNKRQYEKENFGIIDSQCDEIGVL